MFSAHRGWGKAIWKFGSVGEVIVRVRSRGKGWKRTATGRHGREGRFKSNGLTACAATGG